jgi:hypothetical protein
VTTPRKGIDDELPLRPPETPEGERIPAQSTPETENYVDPGPGGPLGQVLPNASTSPPETASTEPPSSADTAAHTSPTHHVNANRLSGNAFAQDVESSLDAAGCNYDAEVLYGLEQKTAEGNPAGIVEVRPDFALRDANGSPIAAIEAKAGAAVGAHERAQAAGYRALGQEWGSNTTVYVTADGTTSKFGPGVLQKFDGAEIIECGNDVKGGLERYESVRLDQPGTDVLLTCRKEDAGATAQSVERTHQRVQGPQDSFAETDSGQQTHDTATGGGERGDSPTRGDQSGDSPDAAQPVDPPVAPPFPDRPPTAVVAPLEGGGGPLEGHGS